MSKRMMMILGAVAVGAVGVFAWFYVAQYLDQGLTASGTIEATEVVVSSKVPGHILSLNYDEGDSVSKEALIAKIDPTDARAALLNAQARFDEAKSDFLRNKQLFGSNMISAQQYDAAKANYEAAQAGLDQAKDGFVHTDITAPISGVVLVKAVEVGELANFGTPIVTLADIRLLKLMVYLNEKDIGKIKLGDVVKVTVDAYPNQTFTGKITHISDKAEFTPKAIQTKDERTTLVFGIKVEIPNPDQKLKPGMPADAAF